MNEKIKPEGVLPQDEFRKLAGEIAASLQVRTDEGEKLDIPVRGDVHSLLEDAMQYAFRLGCRWSWAKERVLELESSLRGVLTIPEHKHEFYCYDFTDLEEGEELQEGDCRPCRRLSGEAREKAKAVLGEKQ